jgi:hypothetical protein
MRVDVDFYVNKDVIDRVISFDMSLQDEDNAHKSRFFLVMRAAMLDASMHSNRM